MNLSRVPSPFSLFYVRFMIFSPISIKLWKNLWLIFIFHLSIFIPSPIFNLNFINVTFLLFLRVNFYREKSYIQSLKLITKNMCDYCLLSISFFNVPNFSHSWNSFSLNFVPRFPTFESNIWRFLSCKQPNLLVRVTTGCRRISFIILWAILDAPFLCQTVALWYNLRNGVFLGGHQYLRRFMDHDRTAAVWSVKVAGSNIKLQ